MQQALLGIDIGTTNTKVVAFSRTGQELAKGVAPTETHYPRAGWVEYDVDLIWQTACALLKEVTASLPDDVTPVAVSIAGMAEAGVPLSASGEALFPAISWLDQRTNSELDNWRETIGAERTAFITGLPMNTAAGVLRLLWLRNNIPDAFDKTKHWLNLPDFFAYRLSSIAATEYSLASRMMILDLNTKQWSAELLKDNDLSENLFGELVQAGEPIGSVTEEAATLSGLPAGIPVCIGGHDHLCAAVALGVTEPGDVFDSIGTSEAIVVTLDAPKPSAGIAALGIAQGVHVAPGNYYAIAGLYYSGGSIDWVRKILTNTLNEGVSSAEAFEQIIQRAAIVDPGSGGVYFLPHLQQANPPIFDPLSRAAFVGMTSETDSAQLARAVMEGLAYEFQRLSDSVRDAFALNNVRQTASGGGTRNQLLMEIKSALAGTAICIPDVDEASCMGAAVLAGIGVGLYKDVEDAQSQMRFSKRMVEADPDMHEIYSKNYQRVFIHLYDTLQSINRKIAETSASEDD